MLTQPAITEADRVAAGQYLDGISTSAIAKKCREGEGWRYTASAFASHRTQSTAPLEARTQKLIDQVTHAALGHVSRANIDDALRCLLALAVETQDFINTALENSHD